MRLQGLVFALIVATTQLAGAGCGESVPSELRVSGPSGFVRCLALEPPRAREWRVGALSFALADRVLTLNGAGATQRVAVLTGPAPTNDDGARVLRAVKARRAQLVLVLGGLGDDRAHATRTAQALAATGIVTLFVAGGRDEPEVVSAALAALDEDARDRVLEVTALERIVIGGNELVPIGGAPAGRYARSAGACGYTASDLDARAAALGAASAQTRRVLLSWAAASPAPGIERAEAGDAELARFAVRIGAEDALAGWPRELAGRPLPGAGLRRIAPSAGGVAALGPEGGRVPPGASFFSLAASGLAELHETQENRAEIAP